MNVKDIIQAKVLECLENGIPAWVRPYRMIGRPMSHRKRLYNGINVLMLSSCCYASPIWLTYKNVKEEGGYVIEGEHASMVLAWFNTKYFDEKELPDGDIEQIERTGWSLRFYKVFNLCQTSLWDKEKVVEEVIDNVAILSFIKEARVTIMLNKGIPFYDPKTDIIGMPPKANFDNEDEYYSTLFHEMVHATLLPLKRKLSYETEELVAEIGSSMICQEFGIIKQIDNSVAYCANWAKHIKENKKALLTASSEANRAVKYLFGER